MYVRAISCAMWRYEKKKKNVSSVSAFLSFDVCQMRANFFLCCRLIGQKSERGDLRIVNHSDGRMQSEMLVERAWLDKFPVRQRHLTAAGERARRGLVAVRTVSIIEGSIGQPARFQRARDLPLKFLPAIFAPAKFTPTQFLLVKIYT